MTDNTAPSGPGPGFCYSCWLRTGDKVPARYRCVECHRYACNKCGRWWGKHGFYCSDHWDLGYRKWMAETPDEGGGEADASPS